ncbi:MAG: fibronectin type III domain-containing protein, partial [Myxococcales bacterium]|nr:fibronectin type III domain-containing protein [Myxococcales bacterium]
MPLVSGARARCGAPALVLALALAGGGCAGGEAAVPRAPTGLSAVAGNRAVTLTFDSDPALKYAVYFAKSPDVTKDDSRLLAESPFRHRDLENGTRLYYRVAAFNNVGESELSAEV